MNTPIYLAALDLSTRVIERRPEWGQHDAVVAEDATRAAMGLLASISRGLATGQPWDRDLGTANRHITNLCVLLRLGATRGSLPGAEAAIVAAKLAEISGKLRTMNTTEPEAAHNESQNLPPPRVRRLIVDGRPLSYAPNAPTVV